MSWYYKKIERRSQDEIERKRQEALKKTLKTVEQKKTIKQDKQK